MHPEQNIRIGQLISKWNRQELDTNDTEELFEWIEKSENNKVLFDQLTNKTFVQQQLQSFLQFDPETARLKIDLNNIFFTYYPCRIRVITYSKNIDVDINFGSSEFCLLSSKSFQLKVKVRRCNGLKCIPKFMLNILKIIYFN